MISLTQTAYGSRVLRHGKLRALRRNQAIRRRRKRVLHAESGSRTDVSVIGEWLSPENGSGEAG